MSEETDKSSEFDNTHVEKTNNNNNEQPQVQYNYYPPSQDNRKSSKQIDIKLKLHPHVDWHMPQI